MKKILLAAPLAAAMAVASLAGCASAPSSSSSTSSTSGASTSAGGSVSASNFKACMVSDLGGFDDKSFNQTSHAGLVQAAQQLGVMTGQVQSSSAKDYATNIQAMVTQKCNLIIGVGFELSDAAVAAAKANPSIKFAIVDDNPAGAKGLANFKALVFNTAQSSFEAGYLAASMSTSGKVGTYGGMKIPTVTVYMDGFAQGVAYYNSQKNKSVQVLGWNATKQDGQFVPAAGGNPFANVSGGQTTAQALVSQGADILFPVAGGAGLGALKVAQSSGGKVNAIWVDTDGCVSAASYCSILLTSVYKGMDVAVFNAIKSAVDGSWSSTPYIGTLANDGTGISPFHTYAAKIPAGTQSELTAIKAGIISGAIKITSTSQPK